MWYCRQQYRIADNEEKQLAIAKNCILAKIYNSRNVINRAMRDHPQRVNKDRLDTVSVQLADRIVDTKKAAFLDELRGYEGEAAARYFSVFNELILQQKEAFYFDYRNKRPPLDNVNAMLSFVYTLLTNEFASALEAVGLDPYVGFLHTDRPGRVSLALDMIEELRPIFADRFVISLINKKVVNDNGFFKQENGAIYMDEKTRKDILRNWQERKQEKIRHPFLGDNVEWGLIPYVQSMLLARYIRGDLDAYPPFMWK